jgi:hypothetical protein
MPYYAASPGELSQMNFPIPPQTHLERLKLSATYLSLQRGLKRSGWGSVGWGIFTLALGVISRSHTLLDSIWIAIGFFMLLEGMWVLRAANLDPRVIQLEAAALAILGLWNTVGLYFEIQAGMKPLFGGRIIVVGIVQLIGAYTTFKSYPTYKNIYAHLDRACLHELEMKMGDMGKRKPQVSADLVEFKGDDKKCKAKFLPDAVIILKDGKQIVICERAEVIVNNTGTKMLSKQTKVELTMDGEKSKTQMGPECLARWQSWLSEEGLVKSANPAIVPS